MKADLATAIVVSILGVLIAYFGCNFFVGEIEDVSVKKINPIATDLPEPDPEVFNYRSLNPTVEVYVGNCDSSDGSQCVNDNAENEIINLELDNGLPTPSGSESDNPGGTPEQGNQ